MQSSEQNATKIAQVLPTSRQAASATTGTVGHVLEVVLPFSLSHQNHNEADIAERDFLAGSDVFDGDDLIGPRTVATGRGLGNPDIL